MRFPWNKEDRSAHTAWKRRARKHRATLDDTDHQVLLGLADSDRPVDLFELAQRRQLEPEATEASLPKLEKIGLVSRGDKNKFENHTYVLLSE